MVMQSVQVAVALRARADLDPAMAGLLGDLSYAVSVIAYVPLAVLLTAVAVLSLRHAALPTWVGWLSAVAAAVNLLMTFGIVVESGPLVPGGWLTYLLYFLTAIWLPVVTTVIVVRLGRSSGTATQTGI
jgi:hypothetical protein